ncbi:MAG: 2-hydroxychromene-2-carboxylate isomerase [Candidatus Binatia bacterium]
MVASLEFWFEFASTYSYLAAARIERLADEARVPLVWRPFLLGPIFKSQGWNDSPFNIYPAKGRYMWRDMERLCARYGLPLRRPSQFPRGALLAARVATVGASEAWGPEFVRAVYRANFADDRDIGAPDTVRSIVDELGQPGAALVELAQSSTVKDTLRAQTERAIQLGVFGAPAFVTRGELFWGNDRLEDALAWARGDG